METNYRQLAEELTTLADAAGSVEDLMSVFVGRLHERLRHFDWVGFYMIEKGLPGEDPVLVLGPYVGADTPTSAFPSIKAFVERRPRRDKPWWWTMSRPIRVTWRARSRPAPRLSCPCG